MFDKSERDIAIAALRDRLLSTNDKTQKERINQVILKLKRHRETGFITRKELADQYGISPWKLLKDVKSNKSLMDELLSTGWHEQRSGFYPKQVAVINKYLGT